jgi:hypothetical protein
MEWTGIVCGDGGRQIDTSAIEAWNRPTDRGWSDVAKSSCI